MGEVGHREEKGGRSAWTLCSGRPLSAADAAQVGDREKNIYGSHGKVAVRGAPKRASHALPSSPFSLLPTLDAHCIVSTHYLLLPPPYSLL